MNLRIGYFAHWFQPDYKLEEFLNDLGFHAEKIDYSRQNYLEQYDVVLIEQNGFNDYIENDEEYIQEWVKRGGICLFLHQDYTRWAPYFLPKEVGYTQLIHRHVSTIRNRRGETYKNYMLPWIEPCGQELFHVPNRITPDEMLDWNVPANSFELTQSPAEKQPEYFRSAAQSCFLANPAWEILGSYMDPAVKDGALILQAKYGKGLYFLNQLMIPELRLPETDRCFRFWKKYFENLLTYFARFKAGLPAPEWEIERTELPIKKNYKMAIHMHSLDWYGCDSAPGTINAEMRYMGFDICALAVKDVGPYSGKLDPARYSDDKVLFLDGQEYHPFNWQTSTDHVGHNNYHMLPIGIDPDSYTPRYTRSLYGDEQVDAYLKEAISYVHEHHGAVCATHPVKVDYWFNYDYDAVDEEPLIPLAGTNIERFWLGGGRIAIMDSVDLFGFRRILDNPAVNFIYLQGEKPCRDSVVRAIRNHHTIAAAWFDEADVTLNGHLPGDEITPEEASNGVVSIHAKSSKGVIREIRIFAGPEVIWKTNPGVPEVTLEVPLKNQTPDRFIRVEAEGEDREHILISTPFFLPVSH